MCTTRTVSAYFRSSGRSSRDSFVLLLLVLLTPLFASSQESTFDAGVVAGLNTSQISGDDLSGFHQFGLNGGLFVSSDVSDNVSLELQMAFSQKGSRKTPNPEVGNYRSYNLRVNYIDLPLMLRYSFEGFGLFAGPLFGAQIGQVKEEDQNGKILQAGRPGFKPYDLGVHLGLGYRFGEKFSMDLRFSNSVLAARKFAGGTTNSRGTGQYLNRGQYHTLVTFLLKYRFLGE